MGKTYARLTQRGMHVIDGEVTCTTRSVPVRVMAVAEGYAMVRQRGAMPIAVNALDVEEISRAEYDKLTKATTHA